MNKLFLYYIVLFSLSCSDSNLVNKEDKINSIDSSTLISKNEERAYNQTQNSSKALPLNTTVDTLSTIESNFMSLILKENELILITKEVERTFSESGKLISSKMIFPKKILTDGGYINMEVLIYGNISDRVRINYSYNMGQASYGYGSVVGDDVNNYLHTIKSCGISNCVTQVFDTGKKIFEKSNEN